MANLFNFIENRDAIEKAHLQAPKPWITWTTSTPLPATRQGMAPKVYLKQVTLGLLDLKMKVTAEEAPKANVPAGDP